MNQTATINKNNYYQIPRFIIALIFSNQRGGKYTATKTEIKNNYYFKLPVPGMNLELNVPFKAILKDNTKIKGIKALNFSTAKDCSSHRRGLCQVKSIYDCYAFQGEERNKNDITDNGSLKINSRHQIELSVYFIEVLKHKKDTLKNFINYLNARIKYLRFSVNGDFKSQADIDILTKICKSYNGICYGYTAADWLDFQELQKFAAVNGSNRKYTNRYKATYNLNEYFQAIIKSRECLGECISCGKCWKLKNTTIINLFHKKDADQILNTYKNREFIIKLLAAFNINITQQDLTKYTGIYYSINAYFKKEYQTNLKDQDIKNIKDFLITIANSHYDIIDNIDQYNKEALKELGIIC